MQTHQHLVSSVIECVPSLCTVQRWVAQFACGDESLRYKLNTGWRVTTPGASSVAATTSQNLDKLHGAGWENETVGMGHS